MVVTIDLTVELFKLSVVSSVPILAMGFQPTFCSNDGTELVGVNQSQRVC